MLRVAAISIFLLTLCTCVAQTKQEEKDWHTLFANLNAREIPNIRNAYLADIKALDSFLVKYPKNGEAMYFLRDELFQLMFWKGKYDSSYVHRYIDVLNRYIKLPDGVKNGCSDPKRCKVTAVFNRSQAYLLAGDTISACSDYLFIDNCFKTDTSGFVQRMKATPGLEQQIENCRVYH